MIKTKPIPFSQKEILPNGIKLLTEEIPTMRSVAVGLEVGVGSSNESEEQSGVSHFIEHLTFKGTPRRTAFQIAKELDEVGGKINAFTSKESTVYYAVILDEHIDIALEVLSDIFLNSLFDPKEIELERGVILEEIKMYEDTPDEMIHDFFAETALSGHALGRPTIGTAASVGALSRDSILKYRGNHYSPENLIIAVAGNIKPAEVLDKVASHFAEFKGPKIQRAEMLPALTPQIKVKPKKTEQVHLCLGGKGASQLDEDRYPFSIMDNILGGSMSSRLFQEIREKRGLAYSIYSYSSPFRHLGLFAVYAGSSKENCPSVINLILEEFSKFKKEGITAEELQRAKDYLKGTLVLGLESTSARMSWLARSEFYYDRVLTIDEVFTKIDKVSRDDIIRLANQSLREPALSLAAIGPFEEGERPVGELKC